VVAAKSERIAYARKLEDPFRARVSQDELLASMLP
jgi:hypothetical protein